MTAIELRDAAKEYSGGVRALRGVTLSIGHGELVAVVGPSGSGKSTLLHVMGTLDRCTSGTAMILGRDVETATDRELAGLRAISIGFVFQDFHLLDGLSALENVAMGLLYSGVSAGRRRARAAEVLARVGLSPRANHPPTALSGGERQRVALARAVVHRPSIVFADEPTGNLDSASSAEILRLLADLNDDGTTVVVITHDPDVARFLPRHVRMRDGLVESDLREEVDRGGDREPAGRR